jgi:hypothetical protein
MQLNIRHKLGHRGMSQRPFLHPLCQNLVDKRALLEFPLLFFRLERVLKHKKKNST